MGDRITYVGLDVHKAGIVVAVAEGGLRGEVREYGRIAIYRTAHLMTHSHGGDAELEAAINADRMLRRGNRDQLLTWFRIWRTIAVMRQVPAGLPH